MNNISEFEKCSNCGACFNICPVNAISIDYEQLFYKVTVDKEKCIECGKCLNVCPVNGKLPHVDLTHKAFGMFSKNDETVRTSSSGGAFSELAAYILSLGGKVFAATYNDNFREVIMTSTDEVTLDSLKRSKYTESLVGRSFQSVKESLKSGVVLYCGTPCQIAGLLSFLGDKNIENLITVDFFCGGLASHKCYQEMISDIERKYEANVCSVNFRPKTLGWGEYCIRIDVSSARKYEMPASLNPYFWSFLNRVSIREYCYQCKFATNHVADITLADFWQYKKVSDISENHKGVSLVITNTNKGLDILEKVSDRLVCVDVDYNIVAEKKERILNLEQMNKRNRFIKKHDESGLLEAVQAVGFPTGLKYITMKIKYVIKKYRYGVIGK